jgi:hypothetical protein
MATLSSQSLKGSNKPTGLPGNYSTQDKLSTFSVDGVTYHVEVNDTSNASATNYNSNLVGPDGRIVAYYNSSTNKLVAGQNIPTALSNQLQNNQNFVNAITTSIYYTTLNGNNGNSTKATQTTGIDPNSPNSVFKPVGGGLNPNSAYNTPPSGGFTIQGLIDALDPGFKIDEKYTNFTSANEEKLFTNHPELLIYPKDILKEKQDTLQITMYNYQAPKGDLFTQNTKPQDLLTQGVQRNSALKNLIGKVILPIPSGISDSNNVNWGEDSMNNLTAAITSAVFQNPGGFIGQQAATSLANFGANLAGFNLPTQAINQLYAYYMAGGGNVQAAFNNPQIKPAIASLILKQAGVEVSPESILARGFGIVPNSNMELLFTGPTLRDFTFAYRMSPRSEDEARNVKRIIRFFKQGSAAKKLNATGGAGGSSLFLGTPNVFKLRYMTTGDKEISGLNKFKICALRGITVNYAPDGTWAAYDEGQPVSLTMSLNFQELEPIYESDYQETTSDKFLNAGKNNNYAADNYSQVKDDDVGY